MARVEWSRRALSDLQAIHDYVAADRPDAADRLSLRTAFVSLWLRSFPFAGRATRKTRVREIIVDGTPYRLVYRASRQSVRILRVRHGRRAD
ncbi:MAG: type II toxin-antitoxin system RelE/ParE family toxin [Acidobacteria bacterium]|nr:MAG: type II toxin-antitoxin system RelE/ParE family toxin [Acidobacteriota bacterium]